MEKRIAKLRLALQTILADAEDALALSSSPVDYWCDTDKVVEIAGTARLALSFDDADAVHSK